MDKPWVHSPVPFDAIYSKWGVLTGAFLVFILDRLSKWMVLRFLSPVHSLVIIPDVIQLTHVQNRGAAFSLFYQHPHILTLIAGLLFLVLLLYTLLRQHFSLFQWIGLSFVLGGALGNLVDRLHYGAVVDFIDVVMIHYPIFNLADSFILAGVVLLMIDYVRQPHHAHRS